MCISILHPSGDDPTGYELSSERWSPVQSVEKILLSVVSMLAEPNDESGAHFEASVSCSINYRKRSEMTDPFLMLLWMRPFVLLWAFLDEH